MDIASLKNQGGIIFGSRISPEGLSTKNTIELNGIKYRVGGEGKGTIDFNKVNDPVTKACLLTALCQGCKEDKFTVEVATGLPVVQYKEQKEELREALQGKFRFKYEDTE